MTQTPGLGIEKLRLLAGFFFFKVTFKEFCLKIAAVFSNIQQQINGSQSRNGRPG